MRVMQFTAPSVGAPAASIEGYKLAGNKAPSQPCGELSASNFDAAIA
jgi:hypothetical protein